MFKAVVRLFRCQKYSSRLESQVTTPNQNHDHDQRRMTGATGNSDLMTKKTSPTQPQLNPALISSHHSPSPPTISSSVYQHHLHSITRPLVEICLDRLLQKVLQIILDQHSLQNTFQSLFKLFYDSHHARPRLPTYLITRLTTLLTHQSKRVFIDPNLNPSGLKLSVLGDQLPFSLYCSLLAIYEDGNVLGLKFGQSYRALSLSDRSELDFLHSLVTSASPFRFLTLVNLSGSTQFTDSDTLILKESVGVSLAVLCLDFTRITDHGLAHLARGVELASDIDDPHCSTSLNSRAPRFGELRFLSLRGLKGVTDRSMIKCSKFISLAFLGSCWWFILSDPPLLVNVIQIKSRLSQSFLMKKKDLRQTSCTSAARTILNRAFELQVKGTFPPKFHPPKTAIEIKVFSNQLTMAQKLVWWLNRHPLSSLNTRFEFVQIDSHLRSPPTQSVRAHHSLNPTSEKDDRLVKFYEPVKRSTDSTTKFDLAHSDLSLCLISDPVITPPSTILEAPPTSNLQVFPQHASRPRLAQLKRKSGLSDAVNSDLGDLIPDRKSLGKKSRFDT